jgi:predicted GH43/DUF377 family glycosyl hydrolase
MPLVRHAGLTLTPDPTRVLARPFVPADTTRAVRLLARILAHDEAEVRDLLAEVYAGFGGRHQDLDAILDRHFDHVRRHLVSDRPLSRERRRLIGACCTQEYAVESAALFNPSMVPHPDQAGVAADALRFILSLRAVGDGHISSLTFRTGTITGDGAIHIDPVDRLVAGPQDCHYPPYDCTCFTRKLFEMGLDNKTSRAVLERLSDPFTFEQLAAGIQAYSSAQPRKPQTDILTFDKMLWLAYSNYEVAFAAGIPLSRQVLFPTAPSEQNGIEDARFVRFTEDDGTRIYYATYTAYDGKVILPQLMETRDFVHFKMITLNGPAAVNKGMALFPRRINGRYAMLSRLDGENLYLTYSDNLHFWYEAAPLLRPAFPWEYIQLGNCGSPIETDAGWLVLTHGVGPMRRYCIGAVLLDRVDPAQVLGRLSVPLLAPSEQEREGYVPNVVYSCGGLVHHSRLVVPYAMSDHAAGFAMVELDALLEGLTRQHN